jgi:hypothetical protein
VTPLKNTLTATEAAVLAAAPSRRRIYVLAAVACVLAALAFYLGFARERPHARDLASASSSSPPSGSPPPSATPLPPPSDRAGAVTVPSGSARAGSSAVAAPSGRGTGPATPAWLESAPKDAGKRPDARPNEDSIF